MGNEINIEASYEYYRGLMENPPRVPSMEYEGIGTDKFAAAVSDPDSAVLELMSGISVPLAVPVEYLPWYNSAYFRRRTVSDAELFYYNNLPSLLAAGDPAYVDAMEPVLGRLARNGGLLLTDHMDADKPVVDESIGRLAGVLGLTVQDKLENEPTSPKHYLYARQIVGANTLEPRLEAKDYARSFALAQAAGRLANKKAVLRTKLSDDENEHVWQFYDREFAKLNDVDPILASFNEADLRAILADPKFLKFTYLSEGKIANVAIVSDVRNCPWMNQVYYQQNLPDAYNSGNIYYSPGIVSDRSSRAGNAAMSLSTMGLLMEGFAETGIDPIMTYVCDEVSNRQVPKLTQHSIDRTGVLRADFSKPDGVHIFRAFRFQSR